MSRPATVAKRPAKRTRKVAPPPVPAPKTKADAWPLTRDVVLFSGGLLGVAHETLMVSTPRYELLTVFLLMMGFPGLSMFFNGKKAA